MSLLAAVPGRGAGWSCGNWTRAAAGLRSLQAEVEVATNLLSCHLKVLREAGLVTTRGRAGWVDVRAHVWARLSTEMRMTEEVRA